MQPLHGARGRGEPAGCCKGRGGAGHGRREESPQKLCDAASANEGDLLPTVRTCHCIHPRARPCWRPPRRQRAWRREDYSKGASLSAVRAMQQARCGALAAQRNGSGVEATLTCAQPRDVGARVMGIAAVLGAVVFAAQWAVSTVVTRGRRD